METSNTPNAEHALCANLLANISDSLPKNAFDIILSSMLNIKMNQQGLLTTADTTIIGNLLAIIYYFFSTLSNILNQFGFSIPSFIFTIIFLYYGYKKCIKPFDYYQDLNIPGQTEKRKEVINLMRRLRKIGKKLPPAYPNGWYVVMESSNLNPGEVKQVDCIGQNFAVFRTLDGVAHVSDAHCPHLGANLAVGGTVKNNCIECPFHKWRFDVDDGKCVSIPNVDLVPKGVEIKLWTCTEVDGNIHIWYDAEGRPPQWAVPEVENIKNGKWVYHARNEFLIASHMQDIPENGGDVAHLNAIHTDHLAAGKVLPTLDIFNLFGMHEWDGKWEATETPHKAVVSLKHKVILLNKIIAIEFDVTATQIGPSYVQLLIKHWMGETIFIQSITPLEPLLQKVVHRLYGPWFIRPLANFMMWGETIMFHRDVMIWNSKEYIYSPILAKTDKCLKAFRKWFQQFYSENSISFKDALLGPQREIIDW